MKRRLFLTIYLVLLVFSLISCSGLSEKQKTDYGLLCSSVTFSSDKVVGIYVDRIPDDLNGIKFLQLVKDKIPKDYYDALEKFRIVVIPKGTYYLLKVYNGNALILFDYSCNTGVEGKVLLSPKEYDLNHLDIYDKCK